MAKGNKITAIKAYFAHPQTFAPKGTPIQNAEQYGGKGELMECGLADKPFFKELGEFCLAECERLGLDY